MPGHYVTLSPNITSCMGQWKPSCLDQKKSYLSLDQFYSDETSPLTLKLPITTIVVCFVICLILSHFCKQCGPRSDCSSRSSLISVHTVCMYAKIGLKSLQEYSADDRNRRHFQMQVFLPVSILYKSIEGRYRPVSYPDGPRTGRYRFIKNAYWAGILRVNSAPNYEDMVGLDRGPLSRQ